MRRWVLTALVAVAALAVAATWMVARTPRPRAEGPNILWVVWDTARRDHMSVYGYPRPTTPFVESFAAEARVYDDCLSPGSTTVPAHASMFTGLWPHQHGAHNRRARLPRGRKALAQRLADAGYRTHLWAANPYLTGRRHLTRGFAEVAHPWDDEEQARALIRAKIHPDDRSTDIARKVNDDSGGWPTTKAGALAPAQLERWLDDAGASPWFAFFNFMEVHRPTVPGPAYRARFLTPEQQAQALQMDATWTATWSFTFGRTDYSDAELAIVRGLYDAAMAELDDLFRALVEAVAARGQLDDTLIVLTSDHGELLGEHHMLDHQYALHEELLRVPLVVRYPAGFAPGRDPRPVTNMDLFATVLALAGLEVPDVPAVDLRHAPDDRTRLAAYPTWMPAGIDKVADADPTWDTRAYQRALEALRAGRHKLVRGSDGSVQLFDLLADPAEARDLSATESATTSRLAAELDRLTADAIPVRGRKDAPPEDEAERERLRQLGYVE